MKHYENVRYIFYMTILSIMYFIWYTKFKKKILVRVKNDCVKLTLKTVKNKNTKNFKTGQCS